MTDKSLLKYSGPKSVKFWARVNGIPWSQGGETIYELACGLQAIEERVLRRLEDLEKKRGKEKK